MEALWNLHRELRGSLVMARSSVFSAWSVFFWACCAWNSPQCQQAGQQQHNTHPCGGSENNHSISDNKLDGRISKTLSASDKTDFSKVRSFGQEKHGKKPWAYSRHSWRQKVTEEMTPDQSKSIKQFWGFHWTFNQMPGKQDSVS